MTNKINENIIYQIVLTYVEENEAEKETGAFSKGCNYTQSNQASLESDTWEFLLWLSGFMNPTSIHEDTALIPGLTQWVKDLVFP